MSPTYTFLLIVFKKQFTLKKYTQNLLKRIVFTQPSLNEFTLKWFTIFSYPGKYNNYLKTVNSKAKKLVE